MAAQSNAVRGRLALGRLKTGERNKTERAYEVSMEVRTL